MTDPTETRLTAAMEAIQAHREMESACLQAVRDEMAAAALAIPCPTCGSHAAYKCVTMQRPRHYTTTHALRFRRANSVARTGGE